MILEQAHSEYYQCRIPGIMSSDKESLFVYYECRSSSWDWAQIDIRIKKSTDEGKTWRQVLLIPGNGMTLNNPVMVSKDGKLHFLYCENYRRMFYTVSTDDGEHWSEPVEMTHVFQECGHPYTVFALGPGHGIVTKDGTMLIPIWMANNPQDAFAHQPSWTSTLYSKDEGATWQVGELICPDFVKNPNESCLGILKDGSILISMRNQDPRMMRCFAVSKNGYEGWFNIAFDERFPDPECMAGMTNGEEILCHVNCHSDNGRKNLVIKASKDDFRTIREIPVADVAGYSDICVKGNRAYVIHEETIKGYLDAKWDVNLHFKVLDIDL